jgi:GTP cyclohydrolase IA
VLGSPQSCPSVPPTHTSTMNSYSTEPEPSHGDLLVDRLRRLDIPDDHPVQAPSDDHQPPLPKAPYDGYGFRLSSGRTSPRAPTDRNSPLPDVNGLGWPGESSLLFFLVILSTTHSSSSSPPPPSSQSQAKSTLSRLNASAAEKAARQTRLAAAVRTVLECIGEDPDREGLLRTPERYAQALMWMTKGYEERLPGRFFLYATTPTHPCPPFFFSFSRASIPTPKD